MQQQKLNELEPVIRNQNIDGQDGNEKNGGKNNPIVIDDSSTNRSKSCD